MKIEEFFEHFAFRFIGQYIGKTFNRPIGVKICSHYKNILIFTVRYLLKIKNSSRQKLDLAGL